MRRLLLVPLFLGFGLIHSGCTEDNPSALQMSQNDAMMVPLAKTKEVSYFDGTSVTSAMVDEGKTVTTAKGVVHIRGLVVQTTETMSDARVTGVVTWVVNMDIFENGEDLRWGTGELVIPGVGSWHMPYKGWCREDPEDGKFYVTYEVDGHGKGDLKGLTAHWTYFKEALPALPFAVNGYIYERP